MRNILMRPSGASLSNCLANFFDLTENLQREVFATLEQFGLISSRAECLGDEEHLDASVRRIALQLPREFLRSDREPPAGGIRHARTIRIDFVSRGVFGR